MKTNKQYDILAREIDLSQEKITKLQRDMEILVLWALMRYFLTPHKNVGLVVVDEQHRFGVEQRAELLGDKKHTPHFLTMTATPIPRTMAKTILGSIDISVLQEMPKGRQVVKTWVSTARKTCGRV